MFRKAERKKAKLRLGMMGASGSGKTWSSLEIAFGMTTGDKIFFIDTESGRGELYQGQKSKYDPEIVFDYNYLRLDAPYSPERYIEAIKNAEKEGCEVLIIDSLSHAWVGEGGVLSIVDKAGGQFQNGWKIGTPKQNALIDAIITSKMHIICNLRVKTEYVVEMNDRGKNAPRKIGLAPIQRDQLEYEFTVFMSMSQEHVAHVTKDNTQMFNQEFVKPTPEMGKKLMEWLNTGIESVDPRDHFMNEVMPQIKHEFDSCLTEEELRKCFINATRTHKADFEIAELIVAKDKRKEEIMLEAVDTLPDDAPAYQAPIIPTASKHSSTLTDLARGVA